MKKILAMAILAVGMLVGGNTALASSKYPTIDPKVQIPSVVAPGETFNAVFTGMEPGDTITVTFGGKTFTGTADADGNATIVITAPTTPGDYALSVTTAAGYAGVYTVTVKGGTPPMKPDGKLPATGSNTLVPGIGFGLAAVAGGLGLLFVSKRRRTMMA